MTTDPFQPKHEIRYIHHSDQSHIAKTLLASLRWLFDDNVDFVHVKRAEDILGVLLGVGLTIYLGCVVGGLWHWFSNVHQLWLTMVPCLAGLMLVCFRKQLAARIHPTMGSGERAKIHMESPAEVIYNAFAFGVLAFWFLYFGGFFIWLFNNPTEIIDVVKTIFVVCGAVGICLLVARLLGTAVIRTGPEGVQLPVVFAPSLNFKLFRPWNELKGLTLTEKSSLDIPNIIELHFQDGAYCKINTEGLTKQNLQRLVLSINTYQPNAALKLDSDLPSGVAKLLLQNQASSQVSSSAATFTELWQSELKRRFGSTAFVPLESGDTLANNKIKIIGQIASGGFSAIYLCHLHSGRTAVLKESAIPDSANDETKSKIQEMFKREATTLSSLRHEQIVGILDFFVENDRFYLVLEHVEGKTLRQFIIEHGPQPEHIVRAWGAQIAGIIEYMHGQSPPVIHRDLSPDNLILTTTGKIILIDLGAANYFVGTATGTIIGKRGYMPLEQCCGKTSPQTDVYALGATLFFLMTGDDPPQTLAEGMPAYESRMSADVAQIILRCTAREPHNRVATMHDVRMLLEPVRR